MKEQIAIQNLLRTNFLDLQSKNSSYSFRSFSKKVDVHVGALSSIMNGKRRVSRELAERIARRLLLDPQKRTELLELFPEKRAYKKAKDAEISNGPCYLEVEASRFKMIGEWEHYAVLSLMNCHDFRDDPAWIALRLGITEHRGLEVIRRLFELQFIKRNAEDKLERVHPSIRSSDDTVDLSLRRSHGETLELAKESLNRDSVYQRDFTGITMAIDPHQLSMAKEMIRKFQDELAEVLETGKRTEVYRLSMQLFPLTKINLSSNSPTKGN